MIYTPLARMYRNEMVFLYLEPMKTGLLMLRNRFGTVKPKDLVIVKDLPLYKGVGSYGNHGVAPVSKLMQ
jgi:hypothetical protein